ncbi:stress-response A/B barrel domain-containing protein UP3-like, partial [Vicia villosa]|uniref:stress-response A/B barrel domain-containing protein UP3-like n=1 Tax=Vicia villosa TaxID=3911 RepID=UPI00273C96A8
MMCLKTHLSFPFRTPSSPSPKHLTHHLRSLPFRSTIKMSSSTQTKTIEHIVLFKVKENSEPSKLTSMVNGLSSLISLDQVLHLTTGPLLRNRSTALTFTHMLHSRYKSKEDLEAYSTHPSPIGVVRGSILPIIDDLMAVDWVAEDIDSGELVPNPGSAIYVTFLKLKEGVFNDEVLKIITIKKYKDNYFFKVKDI